MKVLLVLFGCLFLAGCAYVAPSEVKAKWYAVVEEGGPGRLSPVSKKRGVFCLQIYAGSWEPLIGVDGFGGPRENLFYFGNLVGPGPVYINPEFDENNIGPSWINRGTIKVDRAHSRVVIDLQYVTSKSGEPEKLEPHPANGTYHIKRWRD